MSAPDRAVNQHHFSLAPRGPSIHDPVSWTPDGLEESTMPRTRPAYRRRRVYERRISVQNGSVPLLLI